MAVIDIMNKVDLQIKERSGLFYIYINIDFSKVPITCTTNDYKIARTAHGWLILGSFFRMPTDSTCGATVDIGTAASGTELDTAIDVDAGTQTGWTAMTPTYAAPVEINSDGHIWLEAETVDITDGVLQMMFIVMAAPDEDSIVG